MRSCLFAFLALGFSLAACDDGPRGAATAPDEEHAPPSSTPANASDAGPDAPDDGVYEPEPQPEAIVRGRFDLNDVSILYPLPAEDTLLRASKPAAYGPILPRALFTSLPPLFGNGAANDSYDDLRVVGVRADPCFPSLALPDAACRPQIRLVLQPVAYRGETIFDGDAAVHLLYDLPAAELATFVAQLSTLKAASGVATDGARLGVHPALARDGVNGPFGAGLRASMLAKIGASRLKRVAMMQLKQDQAEWSFFAFDITAGGTAVPVDIAHAGFTQQSINLVQGDAIFSADAATDDDFKAFRWASPGAPSSTSEERAAALGATLRIENPTVRSVEQVACASCHFAGPARRRAEQRFSLSSAGHPDLFTAPGFDLTPASQVDGDVRALRAFGHREGKAVVSQRVVNESAAVAAFLNERLVP